MKVLGFCGGSGAGKTTLMTQLVGQLTAAGWRVSVIKHAHHPFDIDQPGKDSHRHRESGAFEVLIASDRRLAKMREFAIRADPSVHQLVAELHDCDWVLVEGLKHADLPKIEVWRAAVGKPALYTSDPFVVAVCTDVPAHLPQPTALPVLDLNDPGAVASFLLAHSERYEYVNPLLVAHLAGAPCAPDADPGADAGQAAGRHPSAD